MVLLTNFKWIPFRTQFRPSNFRSLNLMCSLSHYVPPVGNNSIISTCIAKQNVGFTSCLMVIVIHTHSIFLHLTSFCTIYGTYRFYVEIWRCHNVGLFIDWHLYRNMYYLYSAKYCVVLLHMANNKFHLVEDTGRQHAYLVDNKCVCALDSCLQNRIESLVSAIVQQYYSHTRSGRYDKEIENNVL